jgi:hypothetical protein
MHYTTTGVQNKTACRKNANAAGFGKADENPSRGSTDYRKNESWL